MNLILAESKKHINRINFSKFTVIIKMLYLMSIPLVCCIIMCAIQGHSIFDVYLPASQWNDELFYYKQVECMRYYGIPQGFFGYNESQAAALSFGAWSPVILLPWYLWSLLFGWNFMSPIYCNLVLMSGSLLILGIFLKPNKVQILGIFLMFATFLPLTRWIMSVTPEAICISFAISVIVIAISCMEKYKTKKIVILFFLCGYLTLMRPYLLLLMFFPFFIIVKKNRFLGIIISIILVTITGILYLLINKWLIAPYFTPIIQTTWLSTFQINIFKGSIEAFNHFWKMLLDFARQLQYGILEQSLEGTISIAYCLVFALGIRQLMIFKKQNKKDYKTIFTILNTNMVVMLVAIFYLYVLRVGSRHMMIFIVIGITAMCLTNRSCVRSLLILYAIFALMFTLSAKQDSYTYRIPFFELNKEKQINDLSDSLNQNIKIKGGIPSYENTIIWAFSDEGNNKSIMLPWQLLYSVPKGMGINLCTYEYVTENINQLLCGYIAAIPNGSIEKLCIEKGAECIALGQDIVVYDLGN